MGSAWRETLLPLSSINYIMAKGFVAIDRETYQFDDNGELIISDGTYKKMYSKTNKVVDFGSFGEQPVIWDYYPNWNTPNTNHQWKFRYYVK